MGLVERLIVHLTLQIYAKIYNTNYILTIYYLQKMKFFLPQPSRKNKKGFTLLELLVVIMILGILVVIGLRSFMTSQVKARDSKRKSEIEQLTRALELFRNDQGYYPVGNSQGQIMMLSSTDGWLTFEWGEEFIDVNNPDTIYMAKLPRISNAVSFYYQAYAKDSSGEFVEVNQEEGATEAQAYQIHTLLENPEDGAKLPGVTEHNCGTAARPAGCNYVVLSTNLPDDSIVIVEGESLESSPTTFFATVAPTSAVIPSVTPVSTPVVVASPTPTLQEKEQISPAPTSIEEDEIDCGPNATFGASGCVCLPDWGNCDGSWINGCEAYLVTDRGNCGGCGIECFDGQVCKTSECLMDL